MATPSFSYTVLPVDRMTTHVISCILHVGHDDASEPWPLYIEDFDGNTNAVVLEAGDMLFYESSKCIHGRPKPFHGSWYSSLFVHYHPAEAWNREEISLDAHYRVPPSWVDPKQIDDSVDFMKMIDTGMVEPNCPYDWCGVDGAVEWRGPAKDGEVITTGYQGTIHVTMDAQEL